MRTGLPVFFRPQKGLETTFVFAEKIAKHGPKIVIFYWIMDTFNQYHVSVSQSVNRQYRIEKIKTYFCLALVMMHIDRDMSPFMLSLRL